MGTPAYMAPEQITASAVTGAADVFSWGATMCFAANATAPFGQDSVAPVLHRILTAPPELGRLDGRLRTLVDACLDKDARNRPSSRELLFELLGESTAGVPSEVLRSPPPHILRVAAPPPLIPEPRSPNPGSHPSGSGAPEAGPFTGEMQETRPSGGEVSGALPPGRDSPARPSNAAASSLPSERDARSPMAEPEVTGTPGGYHLPDSHKGGGSTGPPAQERQSRGWPGAAIAVCAALLVTAVVLLAVVMPSLTPTEQIAGRQASGPWHPRPPRTRRPRHPRWTSRPRPRAPNDQRAPANGPPPTRRWPVR
ncbi:hypothetical protein ACFQYP_38290 [Nonomuraea antimicrobica]